MSASETIPRRYSPSRLDGVRLRFFSQKPKLCFQYVHTDEWGTYSGHRGSIRQQIVGRSHPVEPPVGSEWLIERQPNAIELFSKREVAIVIDERPRDDPLSNAKHLDIRRSKRLGISSTLYWGISDRSFFTRLTQAVTLGEVIRFQLDFADTDEIFGHILKEQKPEPYGVELLSLTRITVSF